MKTDCDKCDAASSVEICFQGFLAMITSYGEGNVIKGSLCSLCQLNCKAAEGLKCHCHVVNFIEHKQGNPASLHTLNIRFTKQ